MNPFEYSTTWLSTDSGNGPLMTMRQGDRVRWYVFANPNEQEAWDIHTPHWHGQTAVVGHMRMDMVMLNPMMTVVEWYRDVLLRGTLPTPSSMAAVMLVSGGLLVVGLVGFTRTSQRFADEL